VNRHIECDHIKPCRRPVQARRYLILDGKIDKESGVATTGPCDRIGEDFIQLCDDCHKLYGISGW
jgi:hypothetical protein